MPLQFAHLEGAEQITLDGVFHSVDMPNDWYGAEGIVDLWLARVYMELRALSKGSMTFSESLSASFANLFR